MPRTEQTKIDPDEDHRDRARVAELGHLRLALATFALQLDAFELRTVEMRGGVRPPAPSGAPQSSACISASAGVASTAWPFLTGTIVGWLASRAWRRPTALVPTGVVVWLCTVVIGMVLRKASSAGVAASFVVVAASVTALLLLGWRAVVGLTVRHRSGV